MGKAPNDQNKVLGANYLTDFYLEVKNMTEQYANYKNIMLELDYSVNTPEAKIDKEQVSNSKIAGTNIRFFANKIYIHFKTLAKILEINEYQSKPLIEAYDKMTDPKKSMPDIIDVETFVIEANGVLAFEVITGLLQTSSDVLNSLVQR